MGADGHTASLFPGSAALDETEALVVPVTAPKPPPERMTITPVVISRSRSIVMLVTGAEKAPMVGRALTGVVDPKAIPAQLARRAVWILDQTAAGNLSL
jgi:6-phosphogluconolactonase